MALRKFWLYYAACFLFLGLVPVSAILVGGSMGIDEAAARASSATGIAWTSNLVAVLRLAWVEPILLLTLLGSMAPALAALLTACYFHRQGDLLRFARRLTWRRNVGAWSALKCYFLIPALLVPSLLCTLGLKTLLGLELTSPLFTIGPHVVFALVLAALLDQGAVLEELGWRGYAAPELQTVFQPIRVAVLVGVCWGLWHVPRDLTTGVVERLGWIPWIGLYLPSFLLGTVAVSVIAGFFVNRLGGAVLPAVLVHGLTNDAAGISGSVSIPEALTPFHQIAKNLPFAGIALAIYWYSGPALGRLPEERSAL